MLFSELIQQSGARLYLPPGVEEPGDKIMARIMPLDQATESDLSFYVNPAYRGLLSGCRAFAVILKEPIEDLSKPQIICEDPYPMMAKVQKALLAEKITVDQDRIHPLSYIDKDAKVHETAVIMAFAYISAHSIIKAHTRIYPHVFIDQGVMIGENCIIQSNVSIMSQTVIKDRVTIHPNSVIGSDGFGYTRTKDGIEKIPQIGIVRIEDDVEIGASCTINRAAFFETVVGRGTKLDSQVHIGHNVTIGEHTIICGQSGIAGSTEVGHNCTIAGQTGIAPHIKIHDGVTIAPKSAVLSSIKEKGQYGGNPAISYLEWRRAAIAFKDLPKMKTALRKLNQESLDKI